MTLRYRLDQTGKIETIGIDLDPEYFPDILDNEAITMDNASQWQKLNSQWEYAGNDFPIPENALLDYDMITPCPIDASITRKIYWNNELDATGDIFKIWIYVLHFKDGARVQKYDKRIWTQADAYTEIDNPINPGENVNELSFFREMIEAGTPLTSVVQYGVQKADLDQTINRRMEYGQIAV